MTDQEINIERQKAELRKKERVKKNTRTPQQNQSNNETNVNNFMF